MTVTYNIEPDWGARVAKVAGELQDTLGQRLTAYAVGLRDPGEIGSFAREEADPQPETVDRLWGLHAITQRLTSRDTPETARAWMIGSSPLLDHRAPVELLHEQSHAPAYGARECRKEAPVTAVDAFRRVEDAAVAYLSAA